MTMILALALSVQISIDQDGGLSAAQLRVVESQLQKIWQHVDVPVTIGRYGDSSLQGRVLMSLRILNGGLPTGGGRRRPVLAWLATGPDGRRTPLILVSLPAVRELLSNAEFAGIPFRRMTTALRDELLARAIGRVAAHELGHYLLPHVPHQKCGLMRAHYAAADLIGAAVQPFQIAAGLAKSTHEQVSPRESHTHER